LSRPELTEEQLRAIEEQMAQLTPDDIMLDALVSLINLAARKARPDLPAGPEAEGRDLGQARQAIDGARALLGLLEPRHSAELAQVRDALSQLQMVYVQLSGGGGQAAPPGEGGEAPAAAGEQPESGEARPGEAGPAQRSGRLWVPGQ
jgi:hypothetical protein